MKLIDKITPETLNELYWHQKMSSPEIAKIYRYNPSSIRYLLRKYKIRVRTLSEAKRGRFNIHIPKKELRKLYLDKKVSSPEIAKIYKCSKDTIRQRLKEYGIKTRTFSEANRARYGINISKKELKKSYLEQKMSSPEIAKIYHCSPCTIRDLLRKYKIRVRTKSEAIQLLYNINISKKELKKLYLEKKMSSPEIAEKFNCSPTYVRDKLKEFNIPIRSLQEALFLSNKPHYKRYDFGGNLEEKAYLIGFRTGDLHAYPTSSRSIIVSMNSSKQAQIKLFEKLFSKYGHVWKGKPDKIGAVSMRSYLDKRSFEFLLEKRDLIDPWILKNTKYFAAFLAGYTDAEGSFCIYNGKDGVFNIRSQDKDILHQIHNKLIELGILLRPPKLARRKGTKDKEGTISNENIWGIWVYRKDALLKLIDLINLYLKHADKRKSMEIVKNNVLERNKKYNNRRDTYWYKSYLKEGIKV